jgi:prepilin-type processing-associated H-X9-DG protein
MKNKRLAFSLPEILVVIGVIGLVTSLSLSAVQSARSAASRVACSNQLKQLGLAIHHYESIFGCIPPSSRQGYGSPNPDSALSSFAHLLPFLEEQATYDLAASAAYRDADARNQSVHSAGTRPIKAFSCPSDSRVRRSLVNGRGLVQGCTSYMGISDCVNRDSAYHNAGFFSQTNLITFALVTDGLSNTICVGERPPPDNGSAGWWYSSNQYFGSDGPMNLMCLGCEGVVDPFGPNACPRALLDPFQPGALGNPCDRFHLWSLHPAGANFLFGDGAVRFLPYSASARLYGLVSIADGTGSTDNLP